MQKRTLLNKLSVSTQTATVATFLVATAMIAYASSGDAKDGDEKKLNRQKAGRVARQERPATIDFVLEKEVAVGSGGALKLEADRGSVEVIPADVNRVSVEVIRSIAEKYVHEAEAILKHHEVVISREGNNAIVQSRLKPIAMNNVVVDGVGIDVSDDIHRAVENAVGKRLKNIHFLVTIPAKFDVKLKTGGQNIVCGDLGGQAHCTTSGGGIKLGKIAGQVHATTSGGSLQLAAAGDSVELRTSGGSVRAGNILGDAVVATSGGSIRLGRVRGRVSAKTSGGSIRILDAGGAIEAITSGGSVTAAISQQPKTDSYFATSGGSVNVALDKGLAFDFEHLGHGKATGPFLNSAGRHPRTAKLNGGGPKLVTKGNVRFTYFGDK